VSPLLADQQSALSVDGSSVREFRQQIAILSARIGDVRKA
jgi:hypothetical protein